MPETKSRSKLMLCMGEYKGGWGSVDPDRATPMRCFRPIPNPERLREEMSEAEFEALPVDYSCSKCGWLQTSTAGGAAELCTSATWWDWEQSPETRDGYARLARVARSGGYEIPDVPPCRAYTAA